MKTNKKRTSGKMPKMKNGYFEQSTRNIHVLEMSHGEAQRMMERIEEGKKVTRSCFMCGRSENYSSAHLLDTGEGLALNEVPQALVSFTRKIKNLAFHFSLCMDHAILLAGKSADDDE